jgi:hypothetical protein
MPNNLKIEYLKTSLLIPYASNSRTHSDEQVAQIAGSIKEFGFTNPVLIDEQSGIIAGHGRVLAARKLGMETLPCIRLAHLTDAQRRAYVIADNKLALNAGWNEETLKAELERLSAEGFNLSLTGFDKKDIDSLFSAAESYTKKIKAPVYEPKGEKPSIKEIIDTSKRDQLIEKINAENISAEVSEFLKLAAQRHVVFNYGKIAEYYCHADECIQSLMEESALVIIDAEDALQFGYMKFSDELSEIIASEQDE